MLKMKKLILLVIILFCSSLLFATEFTITKNTDGTCEITEYLGQQKYLEIPSTIDGYEVTSIGYRAFALALSVKGVVIPKTVTFIGEEAFLFCPLLEKIEIPESVTSIGSFAFYGCDSLESITIPESVTSIGESAFSRCKLLENIKVDENNPIYTQIQGVLFNKIENILLTFPITKTIVSYSIPNGIVHIGESAFSGCNSLESIIIPESVTSIGESAFSGCDSLESITIPESVTSIGDYIFIGCDNLREIKVKEGSFAYNFFNNEKFSHLLDYTPSWL